MLGRPYSVQKLQQKLQLLAATARTTAVRFPEVEILQFCMVQLLKTCMEFLTNDFPTVKFKDQIRYTGRFILNKNVLTDN